ncbi:hypothetical protein DAI22_01g191000 [Oryza sativa Japonica Group]|nr:hypothetical protein DAI22_12g119900 [Oryza sativa Japonica Group]KAF2950487.1 hypothetical protein DAI22_01g191000 [Oryza sativa Japonica Group]
MCNGLHSNGPAHFFFFFQFSNLFSVLLSNLNKYYSFLRNFFTIKHYKSSTTFTIFFDFFLFF